jgi:hypothetical protein
MARWRGSVAGPEVDVATRDVYGLVADGRGLRCATDYLWILTRCGSSDASAEDVSLLEAIFSILSSSPAQYSLPCATSPLKADK